MFPCRQSKMQPTVGCAPRHGGEGRAHRQHAELEGGGPGVHVRVGAPRVPPIEAQVAVALGRQVVEPVGGEQLGALGDAGALGERVVDREGLQLRVDDVLVERRRAEVHLRAGAPLGAPARTSQCPRSCATLQKVALTQALWRRLRVQQGRGLEPEAGTGAGCQRTQAGAPTLAHTRALRPGGRGACVLRHWHGPAVPALLRDPAEGGIDPGAVEDTARPARPGLEPEAGMGAGCQRTQAGAPTLAHTEALLQAGVPAFCGICMGPRTMLVAQPEFWVRVLPWKLRPVMLMKLKGWELCVQGALVAYV